MYIEKVFGLFHQGLPLQEPIGEIKKECCSSVANYTRQTLKVFRSNEMVGLVITVLHRLILSFCFSYFSIRN